MAGTPNQGKELARLKRVQTRFRQLRRQHPWLVEVVQRATDDMEQVRQRCSEERDRCTARAEELARGVLRQGVLNDPALSANSPTISVDIFGPCPPRLAEQIASFGGGSPSSADLAAKSAAAALKVLDSKASTPPRGHVQQHWVVLVREPAAWIEPPNPDNLSWTELSRLSEGDLRTVSLYYLGGLADTGGIRQFVAKPHDADVSVASVGRYIRWRGRYTSDWDRDQRTPGSELRTDKLAADIAEQMLDELKPWIMKNDKLSSAPEATAHALLNAMNALSNFGRMTGPWTSLDERRERAMRVLENRQARWEATRTKAVNDRASKGAKFEEAFSASNDDPYPTIPPSNEPVEHLEHLTGQLTEARTNCGKVMTAVASGGAADLDRVIRRNADGQPRSVEILTKAQEMESIAARLIAALALPGSRLDSLIKELEELGKWFQSSVRELRAVMMVPQTVAGGSPPHGSVRNVGNHQLLETVVMEPRVKVPRNKRLKHIACAVRACCKDMSPKMLDCAGKLVAEAVKLGGLDAHPQAVAYMTAHEAGGKASLGFALRDCLVVVAEAQGRTADWALSHLEEAGGLLADALEHAAAGKRGSTRDVHEEGHRDESAPNLPAEGEVGWTVEALCKAGGIKDDLFHEIREKANVPRRSASGYHGVLYTPSDLRRMIKAGEQARDGKRKWKSAAERWKKLLSDMP